MTVSYSECQNLSTIVSKQEAADLVKRFTGNTLQMGTRPAGKLVGVSHDTVAKWRAWDKQGANPEELANLEPTTVQGLRAYLEVADQVEIRRAALRLAADRLTEMADELRNEAAQPDAGAIQRVARAGRAAAARSRRK